MSFPIISVWFWGERTSRCPTQEVHERSGVFTPYMDGGGSQVSTELHLKDMSA